MGSRSTTAPDPSLCRVTSSHRVFPTTALHDGRRATNLSIIDATVARFSPCAAVWVYDANEASRDTELLVERLKQALQETLNDYPHFTGQLRWAADDHGQIKLGRPVVVYGTEEDPGVDFIVAAYDRSLSEVVPTEEERKDDKRVWIASEFPQDELLPSSELAFASSLGRWEGLPGASVQVTTFACGGFAVGIRITHCLSDAVCLVQFAKNWAQRARASSSECGGQEGHSSSDAGPPRALFDPNLLDRHADLHGEQADAEKVQLARSLPMHRYDWWKTDAPGYPSWATASSEATKPTQEQLRHITLSPSTAPPWTTWDLSAPVDHAQIRFSGDEVRRMKNAAQADLVAACGAGSAPPPTISRLDALLAHVWILINRARHQLENEKSDESAPVYMDITLGLRTRVEPSLPATFAGSPILLTYISAPGPGDVAAAASASLGGVASSIREAVARFTPVAVSAYLHDAAHEISPQRLWQAFLGRRHTLVTSWTRAGCYEVDFLGGGGGGGSGGAGGSGGRGPRYVQGRMPRMDGVVQVVDVGEGGEDFDVSLCLERGALERLVGDERLRAYGG